jgi:DNA-binding NarL/FixJ family response regulator
LVEDHPLFATALQTLIDPVEDLEWLGCCEGVEPLLATHPTVDVVILDLRLGDGSTPYDNVKRLEDFGARVLVYTNGEHPDLLRSAAQAGVTGVVLKKESAAVVIDAIRSVAAGEPVLNTHWAAAIDGDRDLEAVGLSPRLQRVLTRYGDGEGVPTIARELVLKEDTVKGYLKEIRLAYASVGRPIRSKTDVTKRAMEDGWLPYPARRRRRR